MAVLFERVTIAGVGLIGGSLGLAAKQAGLAGEVVGFGRTRANLTLAHERGLIDRIAADPAAAAADADVIVLAGPPGACAGLAASLRPHARAGTLLTDVASVKEAVVAALEAAWGSVGPVVGTHPIAGSHASGASAARADLFRDRLCVLTPTPATDRGALARIRALWQGVGARTEDMSPRQHDAILARISHVPHLVAYALVAAAADSVIDGRPVLDYAGSGFLDTTRIAGSRAEIWRDIVRANAGAIRAALGEFRAALDRLEELARSSDGNDLEKALASAAAHRQRLGGPR